MRPDPRGIGWRRHIQILFYNILERRPFLDLMDLRTLIILARAYPYDILFLRKYNFPWVFMTPSNRSRQLVREQSQSIPCYASIHGSYELDPL